MIFLSASAQKRFAVPFNRSRPPQPRLKQVHTPNHVLIPTGQRQHSNEHPSMRPVEFGEALPAGTRLTLFSEDKPDRFFAVIKFWMDETLGASLALGTGVPSYQGENEEGRTHLLIHPAIEEQNERRWYLWRPDHAGFDSRSIFKGALVEE